VSEANTADGAAVPVLQVESLTKHYPVRDAAVRVARPRRRVVHAVDDVSFALRSGTAVALVGESGSGKSTTGQVVAHLEPATSGRLLFRGTEPKFRRRSVLKAYRRQVQMIFQDPYSSLNPVHSVAYHLQRPLRIHGLATSVAAAREQALQLLEQVHLTPARQVIDKLPYELSGGQRQRVAIARALAVQPSVLVADEPVSMLDVSVRLSILNLLSELVTLGDLALLYITHDIASARYFADQVLVMYAGQVLEAGPAETVTQSPAHPYTQLLISAAPNPDAAAAGPRPKMQSPGEAPSLIDPPAGCRFHPRCPHAMAICAEKQPPAFRLGGDHWAACWLLGDGAAEPPHPPAAGQAAPPAASQEECAKEQTDA
jgi:peptide/nickel transport system ATP-binding protein